MLFLKKFLLVITFGFVSLFNTFSQEKNDSLLITDILLTGNHITKEKIILRELLFQKGDKILESELHELTERSKDNLLNTSLFNFVSINYKKELGGVEIFVDLQERWYIWPYPVFEQADRNLSSFLKNKEWSRVDYGLYVLINNFRGRKETLKLKTIFGYNNSFILFYKKPYIDKNQKIGTGVDVVYFRNHEIPYDISSDELQYLKLTNCYARETFKISNFYTYRPYLYTNHFFNLKFTNIVLNDSVLLLNKDYLNNYKKEIAFITVGYNFNYDKRDSKIYPLKGFLFYFSAVKNGIGILSDKGNFIMNSTLEETFSLSNRWYINTGVLGQINFNTFNSFYFKQALGYKNYLRGMEYYVSNGNSYYISKTNLKYEVIPQTKFNLNFIPSDKFSKVHYALYFNLFFDTGYVDSDYIQANKMTNEFLYSGGIGIDLVTYYDKVLRIEYSLNKFGEQGIFIHLGAPIIEN